MDNLAHTLVGATLAETGWRRASRFATATLIVAANAPDIDGVAMFFGRDTSLLFRRGWTHGVLALVLWPFVITGVMLAIDRIRPSRAPDRVARAGPLLALAALGTLTHPAMDWLNTYGVRLLMPFDGRWFYGDALFIVDPWLWLLAATAVVLARSRTRWSAAALIALGVATTALLTTASYTPWPAKLAWFTGVIALAVARLVRGPSSAAPRVARAALALLVIYIAAMIAGSMAARAMVSSELAAHGATARALVASPPPANPFVREVVAVFDDRYAFFSVDLWRRTVSVAEPDRPRGGPPEVVAAALGAPGLEGFRNWTRLPAFDVEHLEDGGWRVTVGDVRYARFGRRGPGRATVLLGPDLGVRGVE